MTWLRELSKSRNEITALELKNRVRCDGQVECYYCRFVVANPKTNGKFEAAIFNIKNFTAPWHDSNDILISVYKMPNIEFETKERALSWAKQEVDKNRKYK